MCQVHQAKVVYTPGLDFNPDSQPYWSSTPYLQQFVKSDGIGTLRVYLDDMDVTEHLTDTTYLKICDYARQRRR